MSKAEDMLQDFFGGLKKPDKPNKGQAFICSSCGGVAVQRATWNAGVCADCKQKSYVTERVNFIQIK